MSHDPYPFTAGDLAEADQAKAALLDMAGRASRDGAACCGHPLCPGSEVLDEVTAVLMTAPSALVLTTAAAMRVLGDLRRDKEKAA